MKGQGLKREVHTWGHGDNLAWAFAKDHVWVCCPTGFCVDVSCPCCHQGPLKCNYVGVPGLFHHQGQADLGVQGCQLGPWYHLD